MRIYYVEVALILLTTVWFSTLADALAETQAKNTATSLRSLESEVQSKKIVTEGDARRIVTTPSTALRKGDLICLRRTMSSLLTRGCLRELEWSTSPS